MKKKKKLSTSSKAILSRYISIDGQDSISFDTNFSAQELKDGVKVGFSTEDLITELQKEDIFDLAYLSDKQAKGRIHSSISEINNFARKGNWGFGLRSVPLKAIKERKLKEIPSKSYSHGGVYRLIIWNNNLRHSVDRLVSDGIIQRMTRWGYYIRKIDASRQRAYQSWTNRLEDMTTEYVELMEDQSDQLPLEEEK